MAAEKKSLLGGVIRKSGETVQCRKTITANRKTRKAASGMPTLEVPEKEVGAGGAEDNFSLLWVLRVELKSSG